MAGPQTTPPGSLLEALRDLADGLITPRDARANLRGLTPPNEPARFVKEGRWAVEGGYPTGIDGARMAAKDALDLIERASHARRRGAHHA